MILKTMKTCGFVSVMMLAGAAHAQQSENRLAAQDDWAFFAEESPRQCWAVSAPVETINTRDGAAVDVRRGDIQLMVFYQPDSQISGQINFAGGYPFADGSVVTMNIGGTSFELFTADDRAWAASAEDDARIIAAMKRGADATLVGRSGRGTQTSDKFSLIGFTAAVDRAASVCSG
ncbi:MAG: hypothetical protein IKD58_02815 [Loktanella sp.]|nr:hypothetical protein [Loktanella sp.]